MPNKILLITPPFTQLNTPYPASPYLKGFLSSQGYTVFQADLGIELINRIFSTSGFQSLFDFVTKTGTDHLSPNSRRIMHNKNYYLQTVDRVMNFLQYRDNTFARILSSDNFLPRAARFDQLPDLEWSFGSIGVSDKARYYSTLYIEDIGDLIKDAITPHFGFSRYAEKLGMSAHSFAPIDQALQQPENILETWLIELLKRHIDAHVPDVVGITIPFPGNLYAGLKCGQFIKNRSPRITVIVGGGFVNTELRELSEPALFNYADFISLDDGERPFLNMLKFIENNHNGKLKRTFRRSNNKVAYVDDEREPDVLIADAGCPDYSDLPLDDYLSLIEIANPMHRLWSDGRWNKLTLAHGCYWHACAFCDTSLDYIKRYDTAPAAVLVDRIEQVIAQTGQSGFHFVDEAAPPAVLKEVALELLRRKVTISWWVNIRFESAFTEDLCRLLAASGCIAVTGGLETASDRLLKLMRKGITIRQAAVACRNFSNAGIMAHAYLMYGFPTETAQETVDALEIVRQFFASGLIQSAYWHMFTATIHSDVGRNPGTYQCNVPHPPRGTFAKNDLVHEDPTGCDHHVYSPGLIKAVYNFMHDIGMDFPIGDWFDVTVPTSSVQRTYVEHALSAKPVPDIQRLSSRIVWLGSLPLCKSRESAFQRQPRKTKLSFHTRSDTFTLSVPGEVADWLLGRFDGFSPDNIDLMTLEDLKQSYEHQFPSPFESFLKTDTWKMLRAHGLLLL